MHEAEQQLRISILGGCCCQSLAGKKGEGRRKRSRGLRGAIASRGGGEGSVRQRAAEQEGGGELSQRRPGRWEELFAKAEESRSWDTKGEPAAPAPLGTGKASRAFSQTYLLSASREHRIFIPFPLLPARSKPSAVVWRGWQQPRGSRHRKPSAGASSPAAEVAAASPNPCPACPVAATARVLALRHQ